MGKVPAAHYPQHAACFFIVLICSNISECDGGCLPLFHDPQFIVLLLSNNRDRDYPLLKDFAFW